MHYHIIDHLALRHTSVECYISFRLKSQIWGSRGLIHILEDRKWYVPIRECWTGKDACACVNAETEVKCGYVWMLKRKWYVRMRDSCTGSETFLYLFDWLQYLCRFLVILLFCIRDIVQFYNMFLCVWNHQFLLHWLRLSRTKCQRNLF